MGDWAAEVELRCHKFVELGLIGIFGGTCMMSAVLTRRGPCGKNSNYGGL